MATLNINGQRVTVDDSFLQLSPEQQEQTVNEIAQQLGAAGSVDGAKPESGGYGSQILSGLMEGATGALGFPIDAANAAVGLGMQGVNALFGTDFKPSETPLGGSAGLRQGLAIDPISDQMGHQVARRVAQSVGGAAVPVLGGGGTAGQMAAGLGTATGGGFGAAAMQQLLPDNIGAEILGEVVGAAGTGAAIQGIANSLTRRAAEKSVPTIEALKDQASDLYRQAEGRGVVAGPNVTQGLADDITKIARDNELITPTGRVSEAYPKAKEAMQLMQDYAGYDMNPTQMQVIRETLSDAAFGTGGREGRIAKKMLSKFDDFTAPLAPELSSARDVSSKYLKAGELEKLRELAGSRASQFSGSGFENALRTEYRNLDRRIIKGQSQGWSPDQIEAIQNVSRGTPLQKAARNVGKLAPTGVVSGGMTAGVPYYIGSTMGGPGVGAAAAGATMGAGFIGRDVATRMGLRNAEIAELLARSGGSPINSMNEGVRDAIARALLGESAVMAGNNARNN